MWTITKTLPKHAKHDSRRGFTIVEILIVIVVIGILAAISIVAFNGVQNKAKVSAAQSGATQAAKKVMVYAVQNNDQLPADLATVGITDSSTTYLYTPNTTTNPQTYCITATNGGISSHIASNGKPTAGPCIGQTGASPTTLADGSSCPTGYIVIPGSSLYGTSAFCVMKYEAKNVGGVATSQASGTPWVSISQTNAITTSQAACTSCRLITEPEWLTIAHNVLSVPSNWSGDAVGNGYIYSGHNDNAPANSLAASSDSDGYNGTGNNASSGTNQRRTLTLTNGEVIWDLAGNVWEWTSGTSTTGQPGSSGYGWRQWNALTTPGSLSTNPMPLFGTPAASGWNSAQGIGQIYSNSDETALRGFLRSGSWDDDGLAGVLALLLLYAPSSALSDFGFRVAR